MSQRLVNQFHFMQKKDSSFRKWWGWKKSLLERLLIFLFNQFNLLNYVYTWRTALTVLCFVERQIVLIFLFEEKKTSVRMSKFIWGKLSSRQILQTYPIRFFFIDTAHSNFIFSFFYCILLFSFSLVFVCVFFFVKQKINILIHIQIMWAVSDKEILTRLIPRNKATCFGPTDLSRYLQKRDFLMSSECTERRQWHEIGCEVFGWLWCFLSNTAFLQSRAVLSVIIFRNSTQTSGNAINVRTIWKSRY